MTCIAGLIDGGRVLIGGDSAGLSGWTLQQRADRKVFHLGPYVVVGFTQSFRLGDLLRYHVGEVKPPDTTNADALHRWMVVEFVEQLRATLRSGGWYKKENEVESLPHTGDAIVIGVRGQLFGIEGDLQVTWGLHPFHAAGCAREVAMGSLATSVGQPARKRIEMALHAAEMLSGGVRGPFHIVETAP